MVYKKLFSWHNFVESGIVEATGLGIIGKASVWGNLPSSVMFIRHVKNLVLTNLLFGSNKPDPRIPLIAVDVKNLRI